MNILIVRLGAIGDLIVALPAMKAIRKQYPGAKVTLLSNSPGRVLLENRFYADNMASPDESFWNPFFVKGEKLPELKDQFQKAFVWLKNPKDTFVQNLKKAGIPEVLSLSSFPEGTFRGGMSEHLFNILETPGRMDPPWPEIFLSDQDKHSGREKMNALFKTDTTHVMAIHPGAGDIQKRTPKEIFIRLAANWLGQNNRQLVFVFGPADDDLVFDFRSHFSKGGKEVAYMINEPLLSVAEVLIHCEAFLGPDSGISHLAAALGVPTTAMFRKTDPGLWGPRGKLTKVMF